MQFKSILLALAILAVCAIGAFVLSSDPTGSGTYIKNDAQLGGINIASAAEWVDWPDHAVNYGVDHLTDNSQSNWQCSYDYNCSLVGTFEETQKINEIHIHGCNIKSKTKTEQYIPKDLEVWVNTTGNYELNQRVLNNSASSVVLTFAEPITLSGIDFRALYGKSSYGVGDYDLPCIEEIEIFKPKEELKLATAPNTSTEPVEIEPEPSSLGMIWTWIKNIF